MQVSIVGVNNGATTLLYPFPYHVLLKGLFTKQASSYDETHSETFLKVKCWEHLCCLPSDELTKTEKVNQIVYTFPIVCLYLSINSQYSKCLPNALSTLQSHVLRSVIFLIFFIHNKYFKAAGPERLIICNVIYFLSMPLELQLGLWLAF